MSETGGPPGLVAIITGRGALPREIAEARAKAGLPYLLIVFQNCFEDWMGDHPHAHHEFERAGAVFREMRKAGAEHVVFAGAMNRPKLRPWRADLKAAGLLAKAIRLLGKGDDAMLRGFAGIFEAEGLTMLSPVDILGGELLVKAGLMGARGPSDQDKADAARAADIVRALGPLDVGQGAVVARGICLGVEAIEGTDLMLARVADLPPERRATAPAPSGVLFKGPKPDQDRRMDLPTVGATTIQAARAAGLNGVVVVAGQTVLMEGDATRSALDSTGLFLYGAKEDELADWG
ncbi:MAG: UDP-2,3-diacylglucosamine diphosphatase LpxI [Pseudomonadota bacterium]